MKNELSRYGENMFDPFLDLFAPIAYQEGKYSRGLQMKTDIKESDKGYSLFVDLPGIDKNNINVSFKDGYLTIEAKAEEKHDEEENVKYLHKERFYGASSRSYYIGEVNEKEIKAKYQDGVLKLFIPKEEPEEKKELRIEIN